MLTGNCQGERGPFAEINKGLNARRARLQCPENSSDTVEVIVSRTNNKKRAIMLGVGLDNEDGHVRVTRGDNFHLLGGSGQTHEAMQEKCIKINEKLRQRGKRLEELERGEWTDLASEAGLEVNRRRDS